MDAIIPANVRQIAKEPRLIQQPEAGADWFITVRAKSTLQFLVGGHMEFVLLVDYESAGERDLALHM